MSENFLNNYKPPSPDPIPEDWHLSTAVEQYDFNFIFPVKTLRSDRVELRPMVPKLHAQGMFEGIKANPEVFRWLGSKTWENLQDCLEWMEINCRAPSISLHYAVFTAPPGPDAHKVDPKDYVLAGTLGLINSSRGDMASEPGWIMIFPQFQRTHVLTHAAGLAMHRILDSEKEGGLGLRRCQWITTVLNDKSQAAAHRLGYKHEGNLRAIKVLPPGKEGVGPGRADSYQADGQRRDSWYGSVTWTEWEEGVREHVDKLMARRS